MSWAEYKKKREEQENMETSYSQENNDSNNETSSWQKYKQKREEQKVQQTETLPVANKANTAPKTTTNLTEADLRKIEQNSGLKTGTLNLNKMQAQQQKFNNLQQKGNEILQDKNNKIYDVDYIYSDLGIDNGKVFKKSSAFKDGYDFGDITKTVLDTGATLGTEVTKGVANIGENIGDLASYGIAGVADLLGEDEYADKVRKNAQVSLVDKYTKPLSSKIDKNSILGSKGKEMAQSLGYVAGTAAIGTATGGTAGILGKTAEGAAKAANIATTATTFASSMGSGITEAYQNGATDQEALAYGIISGIGEAGSELMFGGLGKVFGKVGFNPTGGALDEVVVQGLSRNIKNKMVKTLVQSGLMATGEGIEEVVSGVVSAIGKKATFMKEEDLKNILKDENLAEQFWMGTLTSVIAQAPSTISSIKNKTDYLTGEKWETTQKNETPESPQNVQNNIEQQTVQTDTKTAQNQNIQETKPNGINTLIKELDYFETAKKYNIDTKNDTVQSIARVTNERGIKARYDADVFNDNSQNAIWKISKDNNGNTTREVIINPNADTKKSLENIAIHELTHDLEGTEQYNKLRDLILEYDKTKSGYQEARQSLEKLYSNVYDKNSEEFNTLVDSEAVADILGSKLGNQEFVNNLTIKNKNLGQRIYSWVIDKLNRLNAKLGYKSEKIYWTDVKNKFENAFKQEYQGLDTNKTKLSIQQNNNGKYVKADRQVITGNDSLKWETQVENYINNNIRQGKDVQVETESGDILTITKDTAGKAKFRNKITDKNGNTRYLNNKEFLSKLTAETHVDELAQISQKINKKPIPDYKNHKFARDGFDYRSAYFEDFDGQYYKITMSVGKNGSIDTIYNIGKMDKKNRSKSSLVAQRPSDKNITSNEDITSINSIAPIKDDVNTTTKYSMQESENNSGSFNFDKNVKRYEDLQEANAIKFNKKTDGTINIEITNDNELINQLSVNSKDNALKQLGSDIANYIYDNATEDSKTIRLKQTKNIEVHDTSHKGKQLEIIKKTNPMLDDYHVGIRNVEDIKAFNEVVNDEDSFVWGDFTREDAKKALKEGKITVYSSYPINQGTFVSTSKIQAEQYAGGKGNKIYSKTIPLEEVAWINGDEGQYANTTTRYSKNNQTWQDYLEKNYKTAGTRTNLEDIRIAPKAKKDILATSELTTAKQNVKNNSKQNKTIKQDNIQTEKNSLPTAKSKASATQSLPIGEYTGKQRKHYKSIMESAETTPQAKKIAKELLNSDTYVPETNKGQLERADARIMSSTPESELNSLSAKAINGEKISSVDIAVGERLIQYYSKTGNAVKLQEAIQTTAMAGTSAGQTVQALSLLNHQTPQGQAMWLQKSVDKMNNELARRKGGKISKDENGNIRVTNNKGVDITEKVELFNLTPEMIQNVVSSKNDTELNKNLNKVYEQLGQQVTRTTAQKIDAWRYFSMLANPKTHIRNITGNVAMGGVQGIKNKVAGVIEGVANKINPDMERSHTIKPASKEVKAFAKADIENVTDRLGLSENKYNPKTRLENSMRTFKSDVMENTVGKMFDLNNKALEVEDGWGLKAGYTKALSEYMTANNLTPDTITDKQLGKARNYAIQQAKEATFHQDSSIASLLNQLSNKNKFSKFILDSTLPFKKTPINVAKAGLEYSPVGLVKSAIYDTVQLRKGNITVNTYIDNISKGLTGSGIALVGYALADCGILKATGSDDEDREKFEESRGSQNYSVKIGDNTYSLDWLAPAGIPLFIGAECYELMQAQKEKKTSSSDEDELYNKAINTATNILDSFANAMNPMTEMSMLSGLTSALKSYDQDSSKMLASIGTNAVKSYVNQFVPTALGQVAKTTDQYERSTTSTQKGVLPKAIDTTRTQIMNKIPGLRQMLPIKTDIWGNEIEQSDNVIQRAFENAVFPWARKELNSNSVDKELVKVYKNTGDKAVLPDSINKEITINKQKYTMTSGEYSKYKKQYGENSYKLLNSLVTANGYKKMSDEEKRVAISKIYSYATEQIKVDYAKQNGLEYEQSTLSQVTNAIKKVNGNTSNYFEFIAKTQELDKDIEKIKTLANSNYDENTKKAIYENSLGKRDNKFNIMKETFTTNGLNTTKYLKYKSQEFESDKTDDGTLNGKTVNGSKKKKVWNYIEQMDITYTQKLLLYGLEYTPSNREQTQIVNYINSLPKTQQEKLEMLSKFQGFTIYKDGTFKY